GSHMETASTGFSIAAGVDYTVLSDTSYASSVTTPVSDADGTTIYRVVYPSASGDLSIGALHQTFTTSFSSGTTFFIDPQPLNNTLPSLWDLFRNVNTSGLRQLRIFKGDGTNTIMASLDGGTGNLACQNISGNDLTV